MDNGTRQEAWDAYGAELWDKVCDCVALLDHTTQDGDQTGFSGAGYSLYISLKNAIDTYCRERRASDPVVPKIGTGIYGKRNH